MNLYLERSKSCYIYRDEPGKRDILGFEKWFQDYLKEKLGVVKNISSLTTNPYYYSLIALKKYIEEQHTNMKLPRGWQHRLERFFFYANRQNKSYPKHGIREFQRNQNKFLNSTNSVTTQNAYVRYGNKVELTDEIRKEIAAKRKVDDIPKLLKAENLNARIKKKIESLMNYGSIFYKSIYKDLKRKNSTAMRRLQCPKIQREIEEIQKYMNKLENIIYNYVKQGSSNGNNSVSIPKFGVPHNIPYSSVIGKTSKLSDLCNEINDEYYRKYGIKLFEVQRGEKIVKTMDFPKNQPAAKYSFLVALKNMEIFFKNKRIH